MRFGELFVVVVVAAALTGCGGGDGGLTSQVVAQTAAAAAMQLADGTQRTQPWYIADPTGAGWTGPDVVTNEFTFTGPNLSITVLFKDASSVPQPTYLGATYMDVTYNGTNAAPGGDVTFQGTFTANRVGLAPFPGGLDDEFRVSGSGNATYLGITATMTFTDLPMSRTGGNGHPKGTAVVSIPPFSAVLDFGYGTSDEAQVTVGGASWAVNLLTGEATAI